MSSLCYKGGPTERANALSALTTPHLDERRDMAKPSRHVHRGYRKPLTYERLREVLHYDPETGIFTRLQSARGPAQIGRIAGSSSRGYRDITIDGDCHGAHRLAWLYMTGEWPPALVDHRDGDQSNNRWANLRLATVAQNAHNSRRYINNTSGFKGVSRAHKKWRAEICLHGKRLHLGSFDTPENAAAAYREAAARLHGEFAKVVEAHDRGAKP